MHARATVVEASTSGIALTSADKAAGFDQTLIDDINAFFAEAGSGAEDGAGDREVGGVTAPPSPTAAATAGASPITVPGPTGAHAPRGNVAADIITAAGKPMTSKLNLRQLLISPRPTAAEAEGAAGAVDACPGGKATPSPATPAAATTLEWRQRPVSDE